MSKKLKELQSRKTELKTEIQNLTERKSDAESKIEDIKLLLGSQDEPEDSEDRIKDLKSSRDTFHEVIEAKTEELESVIDKIQPLQIAKDNEARKKELVNLAEKADKACEQYHQLRIELNELLIQKLEEIASKRSEWKKTGERFFEVCEKITPGFKAGSYRTLESTAEAEALLKELNSETDIRAVTSHSVVRKQSYPFAGSSGNSPHSSKEIFFNEIIFNAMNALLDKKHREWEQERKRKEKAKTG